jgi:HK97 family phage prohead protease
LNNDVRSALDYDVRFATEGEEGVFTGHAAIFGERNRHNEIVQRGAFARTIADHLARNIRPPMLWAHRPDEVIGVWTDIREDATGLAVTGKLITETAKGREALALLKADALNGLSIGFRAKHATRNANGVRVLSEIDLVEISLVALPSAGGARIKQVRSASSDAFTRAVASAVATLKGK